MNLKVAEYWDLEPWSIFSLSQRHLQYNFRGGDIQTAKVNSTYMEIPLQMKYKSKRTTTNVSIGLVAQRIATTLHQILIPKEATRSQLSPISGNIQL